MDVNALDRFKRTPLEDAVRGDFTDLSKLLLDHGGKVWDNNKVCAEGLNPCPRMNRSRTGSRWLVACSTRGRVY